MKVNGKFEDIKEITVLELLRSHDLNEHVVVIEVNKQVVPKSEYRTRILWDTDEVEIMYFVGGG